MSDRKMVEIAIESVINSSKYPDKLINLTDSYYSKSKQKLGALKSKEEPQRLIICAFLAVEKLSDEYQLPNPVINNIGLPKNQAKILIDQFRRTLFTKELRNLNDESLIIKSNSRKSTPLCSNISSPRTRRSSRLSSPATLKSNESNKENNHAITPSKRLLDDEEVGSNDFVQAYESFESESTKNGSNLTSELLAIEQLTPNDTIKRRKLNTSTPFSKDGEFEQTVSSPLPSDRSTSPISSPTKSSPTRRQLRKSTILSSPNKSIRELNGPKLSPNRRATHNHSPRKSSPLKGELNDNTKEVSTGEIIDVCNFFKIPTNTAHNILATFRTYSAKLQNKWGFICGLITIAYIRVFNQKLKTKLGLRTKFNNKLLKWQKGGLIYQDLNKWLNLTNSMVLENEDWIEELDFEYNYNNKAKELEMNEDWMDDFDNLNNNRFRHLFSLGRMINPENDYLNKNYTDKYSQWILKVKKDLLS